MARDPNLLAMGSTLVGAEVTPDVTTVFNVGDSRAYYLDGGLLQQLSVDDTLKVEVQRSSNGISKSPGITQAIGGSRKRTRPKPHIMRFTPSPGGQLLLCSDGLTDMLSNSRIRDVLHGRQGRSIELIEKAIEAGGEDNVSAVIATFDL
jgi:protein phosphatase